MSSPRQPANLCSLPLFSAPFPKHSTSTNFFSRIPRINSLHNDQIYIHPPKKNLTPLPYAISTNQPMRPSIALRVICFIQQTNASTTVAVDWPLKTTTALDTNSSFSLFSFFFSVLLSPPALSLLFHFCYFCLWVCRENLLESTIITFLTIWCMVFCWQKFCWLELADYFQQSVNAQICVI